MNIILWVIIIFNFKVGDIVSRKSYNNDIIFKILNIKNGIAFLKGVDLRIFADSSIDDLILSKNNNDDELIIEKNLQDMSFNRDNYFYLPGKILHIDGDDDYWDRCMNFYKKLDIKANGLTIKEETIHKSIYTLLNKFKPDILVITGHDAFYNRDNKKNLDNYLNSKYFISAIKEARKYEKNQDKLIIIAGACQSNYEELIRAGANFASSPKRINIHALDPSIIASSIAFSDKSKPIDLINMINKTKYGSDGIGGIITNGTMYVGFPR